MAGIAIVLDLLRKNPGIGSTQSVHTYCLFSAKVAASAAAASAATGTPLISKVLFGNAWTPVAHCDAGATLHEDYISSLRSATRNIFQPDSLQYTTKEYKIELKPIFSAFGLRTLTTTSLRSFLIFYLPLLEPHNLEDEDDDFLQDSHDEHHVDLVVPFKKSVMQIIRETTVVTIRRLMERLAVHYVSQRTAWKLLKDARKSAVRKAQMDLPRFVYFFRVSRTTFRGQFLGVTASWIVQVGIETYRFASSIFHSKEEIDMFERGNQARVLRKKVYGITVKCGASLVCASIGAGIGATLVHPSAGQWIGCSLGDLAGPFIITAVFEKSSRGFLDHLG